MRYHYTATTIQLKRRRLTISRVGKGVKEMKLLYNHFGKSTVRQFPKLLNVYPTYDPDRHSTPMLDPREI